MSKKKVKKLYLLLLLYIKDVKQYRIVAYLKILQDNKFMMLNQLFYIKFLDLFKLTLLKIRQLKN